MRLIMFRAVLIVVVGMLAIGRSRADSVYAISGQFGADYDGFPATGLAFGSFSGTATLDLPLPNSIDWIYVFDISIFDAGHNLVTVASSDIGGSSAYYNADFQGSGRDILSFGNDIVGLQLNFPSPLTGDASLIPTDTYTYSTFGSAQGSYVTIVSGSITSVPEPQSLVLAAIATFTGIAASLWRRSRELCPILEE